MPLLLASGAHWVVENADAADDRPLLHFYNATAERGGSLILTANLPPPKWQTKLADLSSRLAALPVASILPPDEILLRAVLIKLFSDRRSVVSLDVIDYLSVRIERSFDGSTTHSGKNRFRSRWQSVGGSRFHSSGR